MFKKDSIPTTSMHDCLIAFGSNQGDSREVMRVAVERLDQIEKLNVTHASRPMLTAAVGGSENQSAYLNAAIRIKTELNPTRLHQRLVEIENDLGRIRRTRWGPRTIDLDLLLFAEQQIQTNDLVVPHPRMSFRRFVLEPACEIAGEMVHPPSGRTLNQLVARLNEADDLVVCVTGDMAEESLSVIRGILEETESTWRFQAVTSLAEFHEFEPQAKLVTFYRPKSSESDQGNVQNESVDQLLSAAASFCGATLELPRDPIRAKHEILAAIEAMQPLP